MSYRFDECVTLVLGYEGGYVDNPADPGGATNLGISLRYARSQGSLLDLDGDGDVDKNDIVLITPDKAKMVYRNWFWRDVKGDELPAGIDLAVFDYAVNSGPARAIKSLQAALGVKSDGVIGPATMAALRTANPVPVIDRICDERRQFLRGLRTYPQFRTGWERRVQDVRFHAKEMVGNPQSSVRDVAKSPAGQSAAVVASAGAVATIVAQTEPALKALGNLTPWVALAVIAAAVVGVFIWKMKKA